MIYLVEREKKFVESKIKSYAERIQEHVILIAVYSDDLYHRKHWIDELSAWFDLINTYELNKNKKLRQQRYKELCFYGFGQNITDALVDIKDFKESNKRNKAYADFNITDDMITNLSELYANVSEKYSKIFSTKKNGFGVKEFKNSLTEDIKSIIGK